MPDVLQLSALAARHQAVEDALGKALFGKSQVQKLLEKAFHKNVVLAERVDTLGKDLQKAKHRIKNHPALLKFQKEQDIRHAMEAECNAAHKKVAMLSNFNLECHAWKRKVLAANAMRDEDLARRKQVFPSYIASQVGKMMHVITDADCRNFKPMKTDSEIKCPHSGIQFKRLECSKKRVHLFSIYKSNS